MRILDENVILENPYTRLNIYSSCMLDHSHTFFEFNIVENGKCIQSINGSKNVTYSEGEINLIRPCDYHRIQFANIESVWRDIYVKEEKLKKICDSLSPTFFDYLQKKDAILYCKFSIEEFNVFKNKISILSQLLLNPNENSTEIEIIYSNIISDILEKIVEKNLILNSSIPEWLNETYLRMTYFDYVNLSINEIVETTNFSHGYVSNIFKKYYGTTLIAYHNKTKIMYSIKLLGKMKINEIASMLGWENPKNYAIEFKKVYGVSPKKYELMLKSNY